MRPVSATLLAILCAPAPVMAASAVTLVLQFDQAYSTQSLQAMEREVASLVSESGIKVDWRMLADVHSSDSFDSLVVVRFRGACNMEPAPPLGDERGYYAFTYVSDGTVLPFSEVECDKISNSIRTAMSKRQWQERESILGRALGRVLAHELFHMLAKTQHHAFEGVTRSALSPAQLISDKLSMAPADLETLKKKDAR
ncbi:MAG TPA: hypothetical protein VK752_06545 [Bryobacteraceae bacterium]|jgi:hypothetical protein|nr:hypothetical protein [Bryobacteraceae bacterium]